MFNFSEKCSQNFFEIGLKKLQSDFRKPALKENYTFWK